MISIIRLQLLFRLVARYHDHAADQRVAISIYAELTIYAGQTPIAYSPKKVSQATIMAQALHHFTTTAHERQA
jgi:hypothetical protein